MFPESERSPQSGIYIRQLESQMVNMAVRPPDDARTQSTSLRCSVGDIAHDLNGILQVLMANASFLQEERCGDTERARLLEQVRTGLDQLKDLGTSLSCLSRGEPDALNRVTDVSVMLETTVKRFVVDSEVRVCCDIKFPLYIRMDATKFARIIQNLVLNAIQAMDNRGLLMARAEIVTDGQGNRFVEASIADSGCGIPPEYLQHIFDRRFSTKGDARGNGLAIVKSLVEKHDGTISVDSTPGKGLTFILRFPALKPHGNGP